MAKILSFNSSNNSSELQNNSEESFFKKLWESFQSLDTSIKIFILFMFLFLTAVPTITKEYLDTRQRALEVTSNCVPGQTNFYGKCINVLKMFGQKSITEASQDTVVANKMFHGAGVIVDKNSNPNHIYVVDSGNNRILGFNSTEGDPTRGADIVFGQPDTESAACNRDNNTGIYKETGPDTLCFTPFPITANTGEYWMRVNIDIDKQGNLYVIDYSNNRVLRYNQPFSSDRTDGKADTTADFVIGQEDFKSNGINKGKGKGFPDSSSLNTGYDELATSRGVSVDDQGNVWIADTFNHRILRFPKDSKTADLVLGQPDFTSSERACSGHNTAYNKMCLPTLARINPNNGELYVLDENFGKGFESRLLVFKPPFVNGMTAYKNILPKQNEPFKNGGVGDGNNYYLQATGFIFNPYKEGEYTNGEIWLNEHAARRTLLIDNDGNIIRIIGSLEKANGYYVGCDYAFYQYGDPKMLRIFEDFNLCWPGGSIGIDSNNNIYLADEAFNRISRFSLSSPEYRQVDENGKTGQIAIPNGGLMPGTSINRVSAYKFSSTVGVFTFDNQLLVKDSDRFLVWNDYLDKNTGAKADVVVGQTLENERIGNNYALGARDFFDIDDKNRMWTFNGHGKLIVYQLPLSSGSEPVKPLQNAITPYDFKLYWNDTKEELDYHSFEAGGVAFDKINKKLYINDRDNNRILRISNYDDINQKLYVDAVIGQPDKDHTLCNNDQPNGWGASGSPKPNSLCGNMQMKFDKKGNLYVIENTYECHGNNRVVVFMADDLKNINTLFPNISAQKVFVKNSLTEPYSVGCYRYNNSVNSPVSLAFDSNNHMVVGDDGTYPGDSTLRHLRQLWYFIDPLAKNPDGSYVQGQKADAYINLPIGAAGDLIFDNQNNLIIQDHTWARVWLINLERDPSWLVYNNGVTPTSPIPTPTLTPNLTPILITKILLPTTTPTPTPTPTPSPTLTPTPPPTRLSLNLYLDGIGFKSRTYDNRNPVIGKRTLALQVFDLNNNLLLEKTGEVNYLDTSGTFKGIVDLGYTLKTGTYNIKIRMEKYLKKSIKNIQINVNTDNTTSETALLPGDINLVKDQSGNTIVGDNKVNLTDYQTFYSCLSSTTTNCINKADLNSDNRVNLSDYSLLMKNYGKVGD